MGSVMSGESRVAVVTGGAHGIGREIARRFAADGLRVIIADLDAQAGRAAVEEIAGRDMDAAILVETDVSDEGSVRCLMESAVNGWGRVDVLVNNAAIADPGETPVTELTLEAWNRVLAINLTGVFLCTKHAAPYLAKTKGAVVNIASTRALMSEPRTEAYSAAKGGVVALTHALAMSLGPGVRVNCVSPGWIDAGHGPALSEADHAQHPAGRVGTPQDVAGLVAYLASAEAAFITGANFVIDGGMTRKMIYV